MSMKEKIWRKNREKKEKAPTTVRDRVFTAIGIALCVILIPMLIANITMIIKSYTNKDEVPGFMGITPMIVLTDSMDPEIKSGDMIFCASVDASEIKEEDIISFFDPSSKNNTVVTHRVVEVIDQDGEIFYRTKGDINNVEDREPVPYEKVVGVYRFRIAGFGNVAMFMQTVPGMIVCVLIPLVILVGYDIIRRRLYESNKEDTTKELLAELEALKAERAEKNRLLAAIAAKEKQEQEEKERAEASAHTKE